MKRAAWFFVPGMAALILIALPILIIQISPLEALSLFFQGAFGGQGQVINTFTRAVPVIFTGLGIAIALRAGLFNIGAEGQLIVGAMAGAWVGYAFNLPAGFHLVAVMLAGAIAGGLWALPAGVIKVWRGGHEVITTIMLNYIALNLANYMLNGIMQDKSGAISEPKTPVLLTTAWMPEINFGAHGLPLTFLLALLAAILIWLWMSYTVSGYELRATGANPDAARANGISVSKSLIFAMIMSGALSGLGGACLVASIPEHRFFGDFSPGYGFDGLAVSLLAGGHSLWVIPAGILFGSLDTGTRFMESMAYIPRDIAMIVRGIIILYVAVVAWRRTRGGEK